MLLYATLFLCALLMAVIVYRYDLYDREPWWALLLCVGLGAGSIALAGRVQVWVMSNLGTFAAEHWTISMSLAAGITEELGKLTCVLIVALFMRRWFNDPLDGLVYGSMAGLGAAIEESLTVLLGHAAPEPAAVAGIGVPPASAGASMLASLPPGEAVRLAGHLVMGGITGFGAGTLARRSATQASAPPHASNTATPAGSSLPTPALLQGLTPQRLPRWWLPLSLIMGIALHAAWDYVAFSAPAVRPDGPLPGDARALRWHNAFAILLMLAGFVVYRWLVGTGHALARRDSVKK